MSVVTSSGTFTDTTQQNPSGLPGNVTPIASNNTLKHNFANGSGSDQVQLTYLKTLSFTGAAIVLNLFDNTSGTQVTDPYGNAISFSAIRKIVIKHKGTTDNQPLKVGYSGTTANAWTALVSNPGQIFVMPSSSTNDGGAVFISPNTTGWAVSTSSKLLNLDPGANSFSVDIEITGF